MMNDIQTTPRLIVLFGRPGAGKSTVATKAVEQLHDVQLIELDVCVPDWMRTNFTKGIYPTLEQRIEFAETCCNHVNSVLRNNKTTSIVSFSFVNTDLRETFCTRFPHSTWVLLETTEEEAQRRIEQRQGHFYNGTKQQAVQSPATNDNNDWRFAPVTFPHIVLDGSDSMDTNAASLVRIVQQQQLIKEE